MPWTIAYTCYFGSIAGLIIITIDALSKIQ